MKQKATYFKVGLFVLVCIAGLLAGLVYVGADIMRRDVIRLETYIDESVHGLSVGSSVFHRGVKIGQVERISFVQNVYPMEPSSPEFETFGRYVMIVMAVDPEHFLDADRDIEMIRPILRNHIGLGLRFRLSYQVITGMAFMEADYVDPQRHPELHVPWVPRHLYVPSAPSLITSFTQAFTNVFRRLEKIDFEGLLEQFDNTLVTFQTTLQDADVAQIRQATLGVMDDLKETNQLVQSLLKQTDEPMPGNIPQAIATFDDTLARLDALLGRHEMDVDAVIATLKIVVDNLRQLSDSVRDNPARLLFGAPPEPSEHVQ